MELRPEEISSVIKEQIKNYEKLNMVDVVLYPSRRRYCKNSGLELVWLGINKFPGEVYGSIAEEDNVGCVLLE